MNDFTFILNPQAGKGRGKKVGDRLLEHLKNRNISYEFVVTARRGDAVEFARKAKTPVVVAVGGDGTVNEVVNGLSGSDKALGVIPAGSGNDLIKSIGISKKLEHALDALVAGRIKPIDVGTVECSQKPGRHGDPQNNEKSLFVNGVGAGFDAAVAVRTSQISYLSGAAVYVLAVFQTLGKYRPPLFQITVDSASLSSRHLLIAIGNGRCAGGGFYLTPDAVVDDGLFDVCMIDDISVPRILRVMPKIMKENHHQIDGINFLRGKKISLDGDIPFYVHADGEIVGKNVDHVSIDLLEKHLPVIVG